MEGFTNYVNSFFVDEGFDKKVNEAIFLIFLFIYYYLLYIYIFYILHFYIIYFSLSSSNIVSLTTMSKKYHFCLR